MSLLMDVGWAWAALAVLMGWLARTWVRGAWAGVLALIAATAAYYVTDSFLREEPLAWYWRDFLATRSRARRPGHRGSGAMVR